MQAAGDQLLAAAGLTAHQHVHRQGGQFQYLAAQGLQGGGGAQQGGIEFGPAVGLLVQSAVFQDQGALVQGTAQAVEQGLGLKGFSRKS